MLSPVAKRVAVVTGASSGIGKGVALLLAAKGMAVVAVGRDRDRLEGVVGAITAANGDAYAVAIDLAVAGAADEVVSQTSSYFGRLDVLVNNAAVIRKGPLESITQELFDSHFAVNVRAPLMLAKAALPFLRRSQGAAVVNISSTVGSIVATGNILYGSTKAALEYLTRAWAYELASDGIRVNCIAAGAVDTPIHATYSNDVAATYAALARGVPLGRMGTVDDIATWVWYLVSPHTSWTTGTIIHADGGSVLGRSTS